LSFQLTLTSPEWQSYSLLHYTVGTANTYTLNKDALINLQNRERIVC